MIDIYRAIEDHQAAIKSLTALVPDIEAIAKRMTHNILNDGKILWMGNGGSAADSQHLAAELVGRFTRERRGLPSIALTTNTSILTAVGNDYGFESIFARQVEALASAADVVVGLSTSGNSPNLLKAIEKAKAIGAFTVGFSGRDGGSLAQVTDICLTVPVDDTARIQEAHILMGHIICDWVEAALVENA